MTDLNLDLTDKERLILSNQYEILAKLDEDNNNSYSLLAAQLRDGHSYLYKPDLGLREEMSAEDQDFVIDILQLFSSLTKSFEDLEDKSGIDESNTKFRGFDGNNEGEFYHFVDALREAERFSDIVSHKNLNSHTQLVPVYQAMLSKWIDLGKPVYPMDKEDVAAIANARA